MEDRTYSNWANHLRYHNPFLEHNQKSCEACYLWAEGLIAFTGENIGQLKFRQRQADKEKLEQLKTAPTN